jgi:transcriptional regulator
VYIPPVFRVEDRSVLYDFLERFSFATLVSVLDGVPFATHLPLLLDREGHRLLGHMARANPHWRGFPGGAEALVIFQGPHAYVSPSWYVVTPAVPTWNYTAVHVYGVPRLIEEGNATSEVLDRMVAWYESARERPWPNDLPDDFRVKHLRAIVAFEVPITRIEGKFKLSQNRGVEDRRQVVRHLGAGDAESRAVAKLMEDHSLPK